MIIPVKKAELNTKEDVINYVTKGIAPREKDFKIIYQDFDEKFDTPLDKDDLELIYENKRKNQTASLALSALGMFAAFMFGKKKGREDIKAIKEVFNTFDVTKF